MKPPPFNPEPFERMRARFPAALQSEYTEADLVEIEAGNPVRAPGWQERHRFDFDDGMRVIVSVEHCPTRHLHLSFGLVPEWERHWVRAGAQALKARWEGLIVQFRGMAGIAPSVRVAETIFTRRAMHVWIPYEQPES